MTAIMVKRLPPAGTTGLAQMALFGQFCDHLYDRISPIGRGPE